MTPRVISIGANSTSPRPAPGRQSGSPGAPSSLRSAPDSLPPATGPERATFPFGPNVRAFLKQFMPIAEYGARCVADSDKLAERAKQLAEGRS